MMTSNLPALRPGIMPSQSWAMILHSTPARLQRSLARSTSKPTILPLGIGQVPGLVAPLHADDDGLPVLGEGRRRGQRGGERNAQHTGFQEFRAHLSSPIRSATLRANRPGPASRGNPKTVIQAARPIGNAGRGPYCHPRRRSPFHFLRARRKAYSNARLGRETHDGGLTGSSAQPPATARSAAGIHAREGARRADLACRASKGRHAAAPWRGTTCRP